MRTTNSFWQFAGYRCRRQVELHSFGLLQFTVVYCAPRCSRCFGHRLPSRQASLLGVLRSLQPFQLWFSVLPAAIKHPLY